MLKQSQITQALNADLLSPQSMHYHYLKGSSNSPNYRDYTISHQTAQNRYAAV